MLAQQLLEHMLNVDSPSQPSNCWKNMWNIFVDPYCQVALRQPLNGYGVRRAPFLIKLLASPPLGDIRQWYRYLFPSAAAALLSNLSKNALPECSAGVSRAVNKVFTAQCERFSCGKKAVNFEYMNIRFRNTNGVRLVSYSSRENLVSLCFGPSQCSPAD